VVDGIVQPLAAVAGAPELLDVGTARRGVAVQGDRAQVRGLHEELPLVLQPLAPSADLLLAGQLGGDVGIRSAPSWVNSDARRARSRIIAASVNSPRSASISTRSAMA